MTIHPWQPNPSWDYFQLWEMLIALKRHLDSVETILAANENKEDFPRDVTNERLRLYISRMEAQCKEMLSIIEEIKSSR